MSHITTSTIKIDDIPSLKAACAELGFDFREGQKTFAWFSSKPGECDHAIAIEGAQYEVGVALSEDGKTYELRFDSYSSGGLYDHLGENGGPLLQEYGLQRAQREAQRLGMRTLSRQRQEDGSVRLVLQGR